MCAAGPSRTATFLSTARQLAVVTRAVESFRTRVASLRGSQRSTHPPSRSSGAGVQAQASPQVSISVDGPLLAISPPFCTMVAFNSLRLGGNP